VIAALSAWHTDHEVAAEALAPVRALPAHVVLEVYAVLTRLPAGLAVPAAAAARALGIRFSAAPLEVPDRSALLRELSGVSGGASYDGLVALEAAAHDRTLLTLDERAQVTYRRLGVAFEVVSAR
jgi:hypothetical protein